MKTNELLAMRLADQPPGQPDPETLATNPRVTEIRALSAEFSRLGDLLRQTAPSPESDPGPGLNAAVLAAIRLGSRTSTSSPSPVPLFELGNMAWMGAACLLFAFGILFAVMEREPRNALPQITSVRVPDRAISATPVGHSDGIAILWMNGLDYVPDNQFRLK